MLRRLRALLPDEHPATKLLLALCVGFFAFMSLDALQHFDLKEPVAALLYAPPIELLLRWGAHVRGEFELWRIITSTVVHVGLIHLLFNMMALRQVGQTVENWYGSAVAFGAFVLTGVGAAAASNQLGPLFGQWTSALIQMFGGSPQPMGFGVAAGASGGLMGLVGVMCVAGHRSGHVLGVAIRNEMVRWAAMTMLLGMAMGFDNTAHGVGFVLGAGLAYLLPAPNKVLRPSPWGDQLKAAAVVISLGILGAGIVGLVRGQQHNQAKQACLAASLAPDSADASLSLCLAALDKLPHDGDLIDRTARLYITLKKPSEAQSLYDDAASRLSDARRFAVGALAFDRCVQFLGDLDAADAANDPPPRADGVPSSKVRRSGSASSEPVTPPDPALILFCEQAPRFVPVDPAPFHNLILAYQRTRQYSKIDGVCAQIAASDALNADQKASLKKFCTP